MNKPKEIIKKRTIIQIIIRILLVLIIALIFVSFISSCYVQLQIDKFVNDKLTVDEFNKFVSKCNSLLSENTVTYLVTSIIALLIALLFNRINEMENLVNENRLLKKEMNNFAFRSVSYNLFLTRVESIFNIAAMVDNLSGFQNEYSRTQIGILCSRIFNMCETLRDSLQLDELNEIHKKERQILVTYVDDIIGLFERASKNLEEAPIKQIVDNRCEEIKEIKRRIEIIEVRE